MTTLEHPSIAKVAAVLRTADHSTAADQIRVLPDDVRTAAQAAAAVGVDVGAIANSLVFRAVYPDGGSTALLALTSGAHRANTATLAKLIGATSVEIADPAFVKAHTGQVIGGVSPVGHPAALRTLVDTALHAYPTIWAAAGHAKAVFPTTCADLLTLTGGTEANVADDH